MYSAFHHNCRPHFNIITIFLFDNPSAIISIFFVPVRRNGQRLGSMTSGYYWLSAVVVYLNAFLGVHSFNINDLSLTTLRILNET